MLACTKISVDNVARKYLNHNVKHLVKNALILG